MGRSLPNLHHSSFQNQAMHARVLPKNLVKRLPMLNDDFLKERIYQPSTSGCSSRRSGSFAPSVNHLTTKARCIWEHTCESRPQGFRAVLLSGPQITFSGIYPWGEVYEALAEGAQRAVAGKSPPVQRAFARQESKPTTPSSVPIKRWLTWKPRIRV